MGRTNIHFQIVDPAAQQRGNVFTFGDQTRLVDGKYKALDLWLLTFLTPKGSDPTDVEAGTDFAFIVESNVSDPAEFEVYLHEYVDDATAQAKLLQRRVGYLTPDERIRSVEITQFKELGPGRFEFWVDLQVESGAHVRAYIPYAAG